MLHRSRFVLLLLLFLPLAALAPHGSATVTAQAPPPTVGAHLDTIRAAYDLLMDQFYRVPDPAPLLDAAWAGAADTFTAAGFRGTLPSPPALPSEREPAWRAFATAYSALAALAPPELKQTDLAFAAAAAMTDSLNEGHTAFLTPAEYRAVSEDLGGNTTAVGVGILTTTRTPWLITEVAPDGPAEGAGVRPGDTILAVDGRDVTALARRGLARLLERERGAVLELVVDRPGVGHLVLSVPVGPYVFPDLQAAVLPNRIGYIRLRTFSAFLTTPGGPANVIEALDAALERFEAEGVSAWVVDLRGNPGGFGFTADELLGRFLPDAVSVTVRNERGNRGENATAGRPFRVQRPMAVLVDGGSASSSEIFASALQENGRAVLVGTRTAGVLAGALVFPLPDGAGLQLAVEQVRTGRGNVLVDGAGLVPDITVSDTRTAADYAAGRDLHIEAAAEALRGRPAPEPPPRPSSGQLSAAELRTLLARYLPVPEDVPATPLIARPRALGELALTAPNEFVGWLGSVENSLGLAGIVRGRGWLGSYSRFFGEAPGLSGPFLGVTIDLYRSQAGAYTALNSNEAPQVQKPAPVPAQLGDGAVAYTGVWESAGTATLAWRSGRTVVTVTYSAVPGQESFEPVLALARTVDARLGATPIPELEPATP